MYGRGQDRIGSESDHPVEWDPAGGVTGLEESMMMMGLRGAEGYPERAGVADCAHYKRTGYCGYGSRCRYNHPRDRSTAVSAMRFGGSVYPERPGEPACQFYMKTGTCKFGMSCKFHHPKNGSGSVSQVPLNILGYPLRPGEIECSYFLKTGLCKFGLTCKFHHPQLTGMSEPTSAPTFYPTVQSSVPAPEQYSELSSGWKVNRTLMPGSYMQGNLGPMLISPGVVPVPGWTHYSGSVSSVPPSGSASAAAPYPPLLTTYTGPSTGQAVQTFPERPGQPECQYYLKTGDCKYGLSCKFHHPKQWDVPSTNCALSPLGLPLRPGIQPCKFYVETGYCKFGSTCKFDHPMDTTSYSLISPSPTNPAALPTSPSTNLVMQPYPSPANLSKPPYPAPTNLSVPPYPAQPTTTATTIAPPFNTVDLIPASSSRQDSCSSEPPYSEISTSTSSSGILLPHVHISSTRVAMQGSEPVRRKSS